MCTHGLTGPLPCSNTRRIYQTVIWILLLMALVLSTGCLVTDTKTTETEIPTSILTGLRDFTQNIASIDASISSDLSTLADALGNAETNAEISRIAHTYYANHSWIDKLIYVDAVTGESIQVPILIDTAFESLLPHPTEEEFRLSGGSLYYDDIFIPEDGSVIIHCAAVYDENGTYRGYFAIIYDLFVVLNYHPLMTGKMAPYGDCICTILDDTGRIVYSSHQETIGETIDSSFYRGTSLIKRSNLPSGAYTYESPAFYTYDRQNITRKMTAWMNFSVFNTPYTLYLTKEPDKSPLKLENLYEVVPGRAEADVNDAYVFAGKYGTEELIKRINSGYYTMPLIVLDYNGTVLSGFEDTYLGLNFLNNHGSYGYAYTQYMIYTAKQGGGYVYYLYPVDDTVQTTASQFSIGYLLPLDDNSFIFSYSPGDTDLIPKNLNIRTDVSRVSREVLKESIDLGVDYVINKINTHPPRNTSQFVSGLSTNVEDLGIIDFNGTLHASVYNQSVVGHTLTGYRDVYGGSTARKVIILARSGGGYINELYPNPEKEGYADLWLYSVEPIDNTYIIYTGAVLKTVKDISPHLAGIFLND